MHPKLLSCLFAAALLALSACAGPTNEPAAAATDDRSLVVSAEDPQGSEVHLDVPYVPTPVEVVEVMLRLAEVGRDDVVYDLGCGDGRIVIAAVEEFGAEHGVCVDLDPERIREAVDNARAAGVEDRITFVEGDLFEVDLTTADVVTLYLLSSVNLELRPKLLRELPPGARVVSHDFSMGDWQPEETVEVGKHSVFFWRIPDPR